MLSPFYAGRPRGRVPNTARPFQGRPPRPARTGQNNNRRNLRNFPLPQPFQQPMQQQPFQQPPASPQQAASTPPINALEQFKRINEDLPDGVKYEPLDAGTLQLLNDYNAHPANPANPTNPAHPATPASPAPEQARYPVFAPHFERLMQDERNAHIFYSGLSKQAHREDMAMALLNLSEAANEQVNHYNTLMQNLCGKTFTPAETEINTKLRFEDGLALAASEENKSLRVLSVLLDSVTDPETASVIQRVINKKIINRNLLSFIKSNGNYPFRL